MMVVLLFYHIDFTFICTTEILAFSDVHFQALDTVVLGVSVDSQYSHYAWANQPRKEGSLGSDLKLVLIAYRNRNISGEYGGLVEEEGIAWRGLFFG
ncbi:hypothetical protein D9758_010822 [Tetrapyrgos nigripes]|uniref:Alkyl hydroperoxide reductase subunit C/ Thiol specific antioxidant domain-containing protein n=1 Tax=Tetrapyrgos nigripes TaxID=182062 RepID=A0A8H5GI11_9AGAR|nr:hypothetical protein D9758_010822 [Tetrapyrgos nigripes]